LAELENRQQIEDPQIVDLTNVVREVVAARKTMIDERSLHMTVDLAESAVVMGDRFLLVHAIENLLDNACRFSPSKGRITLTVQAKDNVVVSLQDEGPGIPEFARSRIYERFYSLPVPGSHMKSSGLGLNFVRQIAELHHGSISVTNGTVGAVARLSLPGIKT
jgi:two-component system sensor histidine kinase CreC